MHALILASMVSALFCQYLGAQGWLPRPLVFTPELLAATTAALIVILGLRDRFQYVRPVYWLVFGGLVVLLLGGILANQVQPGPMVAGVRHYLRAFPFFLLPAVFLIKERQLKVQLLVLLAICLIQIPIAWEQRMATLARGSFTGDHTFGTLMNDKRLSDFMISSDCVLTALFLRKKISALAYFPLLFLLLLPTMLNETKGSLFVAPAALSTRLGAIQRSPSRRRSWAR
jgi:hypothetical protein